MSVTTEGSSSICTATAGDPPLLTGRAPRTASFESSNVAMERRRRIVAPASVVPYVTSSLQSALATPPGPL